MSEPSENDLTKTTKPDNLKPNLFTPKDEGLNNGDPTGDKVKSEDRLDGKWGKDTPVSDTAGTHNAFDDLQIRAGLEKNKE